MPRGARLRGAANDLPRRRVGSKPLSHLQILDAGAIVGSALATPGRREQR